MFCKHCGKEISEEVENCPNCGASINELIISKKWPSWAKFLLFLAALVVIFYSFLFFYEDGSLKVVDDQIEAIQANRFTEAYYQYTSKPFQAETSLEAFKEFFKTIASFIQQNPTASKENDLDNGRMVEKVFVTPDERKIQLNFHLIKEDDGWKVFNIKLVSPDEIKTPQNEPVTPIVNQLNSLKQHQVEQAYKNYTDEDFKKATSLSQFQNFIKQFEYFENYSSYEIINLSEDDRAAIAKVLFYDKNKNPHVAVFTLGLEGDYWKVQAISISTAPNGDKTQAFQTEAALEVINGQLTAIKAMNLKQAYNNFTSKTFKEVTSLADFEKFVNAYPVFSANKNLHFYNLTLNNNVALFNVQLTSSANETREVEYYLQPENGVWKIVQIHILENKAPQQTSASAKIGI